MQPTSVRQYCIAAMYRRCCWYTIFGFAVIAGIAVWIKPLVPNRGPADLAVQIAMCALVALAMVVPLRWKLRVDERGIAGRFLFFWDRWEWSDFASGRVRKLVSHTLDDPARPWWRRRLGLKYLADGELREVLAAINAHYQLPPPPAIPDTLTLRYGFRRRVTLDASGIHLMARDVLREYLWHEVRHVHITRLDPLRRDFRSLVLALPNEEIELKHVTHQGGTSPTWRGAAAEEINEFLFANVPQKRIEISTPEEPSLNREFIEQKLAASTKQLRELSICVAVFSLMILGGLIWMAIEDGLFKAIYMTMVTVMLLVPVFVSIYRTHRRQIAELNEMLAAVREGKGAVRETA